MTIIDIPAIEQLNRASQQPQELALPRAIYEMLEILDKLEEFTVLVRDKVVHEIEEGGEDIHLKLDTYSQ